MVNKKYFIYNRHGFYQPWGPDGPQVSGWVLKPSGFLRRKPVRLSSFHHACCMGTMWDRAATDYFWQLISNVCETDISHVCDTVIKETHSTESPALFTDWHLVLCVINMSQICQIWHIYLCIFSIKIQFFTVYMHRHIHSGMCAFKHTLLDCLQCLVCCHKRTRVYTNAYNVTVHRL